MSDIPVGSPPVPPGRHAAPSGWYPDPLDGGQERYWDGWQWSRNTRAREGAAPAAPAGGGPSTEPQQGHPGHPPQQPGYPPQQGYPGYPPQQGYPPQNGAAGQPGYPPQQGYPGYPPQPGYPQPGQPWAGQPVAGRPGQAVATADGVRLAGWWWRVLAAVVDGVFVFILSSLASLPLLLPLIDRVSSYFGELVAAAEQGQTQPPLVPTDLVSPSEQFGLALIGLAISMIYQIAFLRWRGSTPGMLLCGLRVVPVDQGHSREPLAWQSLLVRAFIWAAPNVYTLFLLVWLADVLFPLWHPKRQTLHDLAARTQVVKP